MTIALKVPAVGESIQEVQIGRWLKRPGEAFEADESLVELETDKASMEVPAPAAGVLAEIVKREGEAVAVGDTIAYLDERSRPKQDATSSKQAEGREGNGRHAGGAPNDPKDRRDPEKESEPADSGRRGAASETVAVNEAKPKAPPAQNERPENKPDDGQRQEAQRDEIAITPSARRALREHGLSADDIEVSGKRLRAEDVEQYVERQKQEKSSSTTAVNPQHDPAADAAAFEEDADSENEQIVPMTLIRKRIAKRLVEAQHTAALLTTFNEIDMSAVMKLRQTYKDRFQERYGVKLGFMSFFVKALIDSLKQTPALNAEIRDGDKIAFRNYYHIGVAVGGGQGLVVPVLRHAERMSFAEIEKAIGDFAKRAQQKQLKPHELEGGTFTISNGGVYGSLLSTPIINPPQSGVLGMHSIQERPVARDGEVVIRPMMYVALTYDHRIVDGSDAVTFLRRIKESVEDPARILVEV